MVFTSLSSVATVAGTTHTVTEAAINNKYYVLKYKIIITPLDFD